MDKCRVLILCTGNSCRSQMAEGWLRELGGDAYEAFSAGTRPAGEVHPLAVKAMTEAGVDISAQYPKTVEQLPETEFDVVITVCDNANENCPFLPGDFTRLHWPFDDPADAEGSESEQMVFFRRVRDEIRERFNAWIADRQCG